jgi:hypothetical protein
MILSGKATFYTWKVYPMHHLFIRVRAFGQLTFLRILAIAALAVFSAVSQAVAQSACAPGGGFSKELARKHLEAGEYPVVLSRLTELSSIEADEIRAELFEHQFNSGAARGAALTMLEIDDESIRGKELARLNQRFSQLQQLDPSSSASRTGEGSAASASANSGAAPNWGGITENDFIPLIDLITNTIAVSRWADDGGPLAIRAYPAGVYVDHAGTLKRIKVDSSRFSSLLKSSHRNFSPTSCFADSGNRNPHWKSALRKVSLTRLEKAAELLTALNQPIDESMLNLAGLTEIQYVFVDPSRGEIVIAGPAGPWHLDSIGRAMNTETGRPLLQLEDFVVTLRNAYEESGRFGCSIEPRSENLAAVTRFLETSKRKGSQWKKQLRDTLGQQDIVVFGIDPRTHAARVLVEADYHMKLVGMGLEPSIPEVPSYFDRLQLREGETLPQSDLVRWWFTSNESDVACDEPLELFELTGTGVRVLSETEILRDDGQRIHTGESSGPTQGFARDFTRHFAQLADQYPVYRELQNLFSLALVANLIKHQQLDRRANRKLGFFKSPTADQQVSFPIRYSLPPRQVDTVMNERVMGYRQGNSTIRNTVVGVSGGVHFDAAEPVKTDRMQRLIDPASSVSKKQIEEEAARVWWWD